VTILPPKMPKLYAKQQAAIFAPQRYAVIEASTKVGKTAGCLIWLLVLAWNEGKPGRNYWWVAPIFPQAKIAFNRLKRMLSGSDPERRAWKYNETELWIEIATGGRIWFKSADHPDALFAEDVYGVVIDEATRCKDEAWYAIRTTLTATNGPARIIGNVRGRKNWAYRMARKAQAGEAGFSYAKLTAWDAVDGGILAREEIESAQRDLPEHVFRELYLAEPADDGGNPFGLKAIAACVGELSMEPAVAFGVDLAKSVDWTAIVGLDELGSVCVAERFQSDWQQTTRRVIHEIQNIPTYADSTGVGDPIVEMLQRRSSNVSGFKFSSQSKQQLMEGLAAAIQQQEVAFPDGWLRSELESFEYEYTRTGVRYSAPEGLHDDGVCALALAVQCKQKSGKPWTRDDVAGVLSYKFKN
jgi:hypothetical protein